VVLAFAYTDAQLLHLLQHDSDVTAGGWSTAGCAALNAIKSMDHDQ
jgi:hypothetical protein